MLLGGSGTPSLARDPTRTRAPSGPPCRARALRVGPVGLSGARGAASAAQEKPLAYVPALVPALVLAPAPVRSRSCRAPAPLPVLLPR